MHYNNVLTVFLDGILNLGAYEVMYNCNSAT